MIKKLLTIFLVILYISSVFSLTETSSGDLNMNMKRIVGLSNGINTTEAVNLGQLRDVTQELKKFVSERFYPQGVIDELLTNYSTWNFLFANYYNITEIDEKLLNLENTTTSLTNTILENYYNKTEVDDKFTNQVGNLDLTLSNAIKGFEYLYLDSEIEKYFNQEPTLFADGMPATYGDEEGWHYVNDASLSLLGISNKINWYFYGSDVEETKYDVSNLNGGYFIVDLETYQGSDVPFITIYTKPDGVNDASWYKSRFVYSVPDENLQNGEVLFYFGEKPSFYENIPSIQLTQSSSSTGTRADDEEVWFISLHTNSGAEPFSIEFTLKEIGWDFNNDYTKIKTLRYTPLDTNSSYTKSEVDTLISNIDLQSVNETQQINDLENIVNSLNNFSGDYNDLINQPNLSVYNETSQIQDLDTKFTNENQTIWSKINTFLNLDELSNIFYNKSEIDLITSSITIDETNLVHLDGDETLTGIKTFENGFKVGNVGVSINNNILGGEDAIFNLNGNLINSIDNTELFGNNINFNQDNSGLLLTGNEAPTAQENSFLDIQNGEPFTFRAKFKINDFSHSEERAIFSKYDGSGYMLFLNVGTETSDGLYFRFGGSTSISHTLIYPSSSGDNIYSGSLEDLDVVITYDGNSNIDSLKMYINGVENDINYLREYFETQNPSVDAPFIIGGTADPNNPKIAQGIEILDVRKYNRVLTQEEITLIYNEVPTQEPTSLIKITNISNEISQTPNENTLITELGISNLISNIDLQSVNETSQIQDLDTKFTNENQTIWNKINTFLNLDEISTIFYNKTEVDNFLSNAIEEAPLDNKQYVRQNGNWSEISVSSTSTTQTNLEVSGMPPLQITSSSSYIIELEHNAPFSIDVTFGAYPRPNVETLLSEFSNIPTNVDITITDFTINGATITFKASPSEIYDTFNFSIANNHLWYDGVQYTMLVTSLKSLYGKIENKDMNTLRAPFILQNVDYENDDIIWMDDIETSSTILGQSFDTYDRVFAQMNKNGDVNGIIKLYRHESTSGMSVGKVIKKQNGDYVAILRATLKNSNIEIDGYSYTFDIGTQTTKYLNLIYIISSDLTQIKDVVAIYNEEDNSGGVINSDVSNLDPRTNKGILSLASFSKINDVRAYRLNAGTKTEFYNLPTDQAVVDTSHASKFVGFDFSNDQIQFIWNKFIDEKYANTYKFGFNSQGDIIAQGLISNLEKGFGTAPIPTTTSTYDPVIFKIDPLTGNAILAKSGTGYINTNYASTIFNIPENDYENGRMLISIPFYTNNVINWGTKTNLQNQMSGLESRGTLYGFIDENTLELTNYVVPFNYWNTNGGLKDNVYFDNENQQLLLSIRSLTTYNGKTVHFNLKPISGGLNNHFYRISYDQMLNMGSGFELGYAVGNDYQFANVFTDKGSRFLQYVSTGAGYKPLKFYDGDGNLITDVTLSFSTYNAFAFRTSDGSYQ